jgi:hypothetical protein
MGAEVIFLPLINTDDTDQKGLPELPKSPEFHPSKPKPGLLGTPELPKFEKQS